MFSCDFDVHGLYIKYNFQKTAFSQNMENFGERLCR